MPTDGSYKVVSRVRHPGGVNTMTVEAASAALVAGFLRGLADGVADGRGVVESLTVTYDPDVPAAVAARPVYSRG